MRCSRFVVVRLALSAGALICLNATVSRGQLPDPLFSMSTRWVEGDYSCEDAPPPCTGPTWDYRLGRHEFDVFRPITSTMTDGARFRLSWPADWQLVDWTLCYGRLDQGDVGQQGSLLVFSFPECPDEERPFLRMIFDCAVPGRFGVAGGPFSAEARYCGSDYWQGDFTDPHWDIGEFCGMLHDSQPCDCYVKKWAGTFDPPELRVQLSPGDTLEQELEIIGHRDLCTGMPECPLSGYCLAGLRCRNPWLRVTYSWQGGGYRWPFTISIDTGGMAPGTYQGSVEAWAQGCNCESNCLPVTLDVIDPAALGSDAFAARQELLGPPWPNPSPGRFSCALHAPAGGSGRVILADVSGRARALLHTGEFPAGDSVQRWEVPTGLPDGVYFLQARIESTRSSRMLVVRR